VIWYLIGSCIVPFSFSIKPRVASPLDLPAWPGLRLRVAPYPAPNLPRRRRIFGLPRIFSPLAVPAVDFRVAPNFASFRVAGFRRVPGCPFAPLPPAAPPMSSRVAPGTASPALPAMEFRVASNLASFGGADWPIPRVAPLRQSLGIADDQSPGCPESCILRYRLICLRVASDYAPSGCASGESPGLPESSYPPATPAESTSESPRLFIPLAAQTELTSRLP